MRKWGSKKRDKERERKWMQGNRERDRQTEKGKGTATHKQTCVQSTQCQPTWGLVEFGSSARSSLDLKYRWLITKM